MKEQIISYLSKGFHVEIFFSNGDKKLFSDIINKLDDVGAIELGNGNGYNLIVNINQIVFAKPIENVKQQKVHF